MKATSDNPEPMAAGPSPKMRWLRRFVLGLILVAVLLVIAGPWLLAKTPLRNVLLGLLVGNGEISVSSRDASFGYFSELSLSGLEVIGPEQTATVHIGEIRAEKSWLGLLWDRPHLGKFSFDRPRFEIIAGGAWPDLPPPDPDAPAIELPTLSAEVVDAAVVVRQGMTVDPVIDLQGINVNLFMERQDSVTRLRIEPMVVFDHQAITPELCGHGLQLVAPLLVDEIDAEGEFSFRLDAFAIPLSRTDLESHRDQIEISGQVELHSAKVGLKNSLISQVLGLAMKALGQELPQNLTVAEDVVVDFHVENGRVYHDGLAFVLPHKESSITVHSRGSVGLDESLDLDVSITLPAGILGDSQLASQLGRIPLEVHVEGTLDKPQLGLPDGQSWTQRLTGLLPLDEDSTVSPELANGVAQFVDGLLQRAGENRARKDDKEQEAADNEPLLDRLLNRQRDRRDRRRRDR